MKKLKMLVVCKHREDSGEAKICRVLNNGINVKYFWKNVLSKKDLEGFDIVVSVGGDGTALSASHYLLNKPLLAVNSSPKTSEGALTTISVDKLDKKIKKIRKGDYEIDKLERIEVLINGRKQDILALNEVFIANEKAYLSSKYKLRFRGGGSRVEENQISSGLLFSTGTGSTAWFKSAGGIPFDAKEKYIKMLVREPYVRKLLRFSMLKKTIHEDDSITIIPEMNSVLAIDSIREIRLNKGDKIRVQISKFPLLRVR